MSTFKMSSTSGRALARCHWHRRVIAPGVRHTSQTASVRTSASASTPPPPPSGPNTHHLSPTHPDVPSSTGTGTLPPTVQTVLDRATAYVLPVYARPPIVLARGAGSYVWDALGRRYLDFSAGIAVNALGHADEGVLKVMHDTAATLLHTSNVYHHEWSGKLAEQLVTLTQREGGLGWAPGSTASSSSSSQQVGGAKVFFANSGTEANEGALKIARMTGKVRWATAATHNKGSQNIADSTSAPSCDKTEIVCFARAFHGRTLGALSVTPNAKYQAPFAPLVPGVRVGQLNDAAGLEALVGARTCAVIVEPVQGEGGIHVAEVEWLRALRRRCDEVGAVLIYDEIQCGLYRTGTLWAHSAMPTDAHPDVVTMAKPLANGYPIGAVLMRDSIAEPMTAGTHGTTFGGSPLACAIGHHVLTRVSDLSFVEQLAETSGYLEERLSRLPRWFPEVLQEEVRGRGMIRGLGMRDESHPGRMMELARERGVLILTAGKDAVRLIPSLNIGKREVDEAVDVLESCLHLLSSE